MESDIASTTQNNSPKNQKNKLKNNGINPKYRLSKALRPFSLPVALITCSLGIVAGHTLQPINPLSTILVLIAGILLQAGVNLINDHADIKNPITLALLSPTDTSRIIYNYKLGWLCFIICAVIGLYLTYQTSLFLLALAFIGGLGALFYTTEPIHYKRRGLGVVLVFFLMGVFMVYGACFAVTGQHYTEAISISIPVSFLTSALLLANELRDYTSDRKEGLKTLTVRLGLKTGKILYWVLIFFSFVSLLLIDSDQPTWAAILIFIPAFMLSIVATHTTVTKPDLQGLPPTTGRLYLVFGISEIVLLMI
ncbi:prenyltransferase [Alkalimarinus alittae]|uniref:Prenyltransferase n=1 Tax=Alkalimarinus alittae TaxID=2961619 RepID=A0ABY6MYP4_9ALTE|nr:prenyltransferase [Alkalimarinus alittae]UZE94977.1 prenyltransferase [Alkalimarinus alittae]